VWWLAHLYSFVHRIYFWGSPKKKKKKGSVLKKEKKEKKKQGANSLSLFFPSVQGGTLWLPLYPGSHL
jgi:hypothetical protein